MSIKNITYDNGEVYIDDKKIGNTNKIPTCADCEFTYDIKPCDCDYSNFTEFVAALEKAKNMQLSDREKGVAWWSYMAGMLSIKNKINEG